MPDHHPYIDTFYIYASELEIFSFAGFSKHVRIYLIFRTKVHDFFQGDSYVFFFRDQNAFMIVKIDVLDLWTSLRHS